MRTDTTVKHIRQAAHLRGHDMRPGHKMDTIAGRTMYFTTCRVCGATVRGVERDYPKGINLGGSAIAVNCPTQ